MPRRQHVLLLTALLLLLLCTRVLAQGAGTYTSTISAESFAIRFDLPGVPEGAAITVDVTALSGDLDPVAVLFFENNIWAAESDDREPGNLNPYLIYENAPAGDYLVVVSRYGLEEGATTGDFSVTITVDQRSAPLTTITPEMVIDTAAAGYPTLSPAPVAEWTILAYLDADNNLEGGIMYDLDELERGGGSTERVRVVALLDRAEGFDTSNGDWKDARLYEVKADKSDDAVTVYPPTLDSDPLAYLGEVNMGQDATLLNFLVWGMRTFPAQRYAVELNNHGAAWAGTVSDDSHDGDILTMPELAAIFQRALQEAGRERFDLLINDSCLMSSVENFAAISPYFDIVYSSPEIMNNPGFDLELMLDTLNANPAIPLADLGQLLADEYMQDMNLGMPGLDTYLGAAVTDMRNIPSLLDAITKFTDVVTAKPETYSATLGRARANSYTYSVWAQFYENIDLGSFMRRVVRASNDDTLRAAAQGVLDALDDALLYTTAGDLLTEQSSFYNIYFPAGSSQFNPRYRQQTPLSGWSEMLNGYFSSLNADDGLFGMDVISTTPQVSITSVFPVQTSILAPVSIGMEVVGSNISHGDFTVDQVQPDGSAVRLGTQRIVTQNVLDDGTIEYINFWHPGVDDFDFIWDVNVAYVSDGQSTFPERVLSAGETYALSGIYIYPGDDTPIDVDIVFDAAGAFSAMISRQRDSSGFANIRPQAGGTFIAYRDVVTPDGQTERSAGNQYVWPQEGLTYSSLPAPSGLYNLGFLIQGFDGSTGYNATTVQVENDPADSAWQGYVDDEWGFIFQYPSDWGDVAYFADQNWEAATSPDGAQGIYVYTVAPSAPDPAVIAAEALAQYNVSINSASLRPFSLSDGTPAAQFSYLWTTTGGASFSGSAIAFYQPALDQGFVIAVESTDGSDPTPLLERTRDTLVLFDPVDLTKQDTGKWTSDSISENASFPVLEDWMPGVSTDGWTAYYQDGDSNNPAYIAITERQTASASEVPGDLMAQYLSGGNVQTQPQTTYLGEVNTWDVIYFSYALEDGTPIVGGLFATEFAGTVHVIWMQAPQEQTQQIIPQMLVTLDGYSITGVENS